MSAKPFLHAPNDDRAVTYGGATEDYALAPGAKSIIRELAEQRRAEPALHALAQSWLSWQCQMLAGTALGELYARTPDKRSVLFIARWPEEIPATPQLLALAERAASEQRNLIEACQQYGQPMLGVGDLLACPVLEDDRVVAVIAVAVTVRTELQQRAVLQLMQWSALGLAAVLRRWPDKFARQAADMSAIIETTTGQVSFDDTAGAVVRDLAARFGCERTSIGVCKGLSVRIAAVSSLSRTSRRAALVQDLEAAMSEAVDQDAMVVYPPPDGSGSLVVHWHAEHAKRHGLGNCCTVLLRYGGEAFGGLMLERVGDEPFNTESVHDIQGVADLLGPFLFLKRRDQRPLLGKLRDGLWTQLSDSVGTGRIRFKLWALALSALIVFLALTDTEHTVAAQASIEGSSQRAVVSPVTSYIAEVHARAGDIVRKGDLLAVLDARDLELARAKWRMEREKHVKEYRQALAQRERAQVSIVSARIAQAEAELKLVEEQLQRMQLRSPFDGVVVHGDLSQSLGAPTERGNVLFEIAQLDDYRVVVEVDEHDIAAIQAKQPGYVWLSAIPDRPLKLEVERAMPVALSEEGRNYFRVEAKLISPLATVRPGMQGVAKITAGQRARLWVITHALWDRLRIWAWSIGF